MKNFAGAYEIAAEKLKDATGGDEGVMRYVEKYREFAKKHPILQGAVYGALIAAAGISSAGAGGVAALGLLKMTDRLLQGDDIRSALYKGAKTGAMAYGASKLGDLIRNTGDTTTTTTTKTMTQTGTGWTDGLDGVPEKIAKNISARYPAAEYTYQSSDQAVEIFTKAGDKVARFSLPDSVERYGQTPALSENVEYIDRRATVWTWALNESLGREHGAVLLTPAGVTAVFEGIVAEGPFSDKVKAGVSKAASAVGGALKRGWEDASNKITYNKLELNWRRGEGRNHTGPVDSSVLADFLSKQGVSDNLISTVYKSMKIPMTSRPQGGGKITGQVSQTPNAISKREKRAADRAGDTGYSFEPAEAPAPAGLSYKEIVSAVRKLDVSEQERLSKLLNKKFHPELVKTATSKKSTPRKK